MARAIKLTKDFAGHKKGHVIPGASSQLANKLVNVRKVAEFTEVKPGDETSKSIAGAKKAVEDAKTEAKKIIDSAKKEAESIIKKAEEEANKELTK